MANKDRLQSSVANIFGIGEQQISYSRQRNGLRNSKLTNCSREIDYEKAISFASRSPNQVKTKVLEH